VLLASAARADEDPSQVPVAPSPAVAPAPLPAPVAPAATAVTTATVNAVADDAADLARLRALAFRGHAPVTGYQLAGGLTGIGIGALAVPMGAVMFGRDSGSLAGAAVLGGGIGAALGGGLVLTGLFNDDPYTAMTAAMAREKALGRDDHAAVLAGEAELKKAAAAARWNRTVTGVAVIALGALGLGAGTVFALADFTAPNLSRREQDLISAGFFGYGLLSTLAGVQTLLFPTTLETTWDGYSAAKRSTAASAPRLLNVGGGPLPGGGASVGLTGVF